VLQLLCREQTLDHYLYLVDVCAQGINTVRIDTTTAILNVPPASKLTILFPIKSDFSQRVQCMDIEYNGRENNPVLSIPVSGA